MTVLHKKIAIILVNWNGKDDTVECLESLTYVDYPNFETIIVDNGSTDDSVQFIRSSYPEITVLETGENLGFAGGNNVGMRYALKNDAEFILLLNNDTVVDSNMLSAFIMAADEYKDGGIFGAKIYYHSEPKRIWYAGGKWLNDSKQFIHVGMDKDDNGVDYSTIEETDYACGCALFVRSEVLRSIGLLDEKYFLIFEENDFCYRARKSGYKSYFVPEAKVWHKVSTSFGGAQSPLYIYFYLRNLLLWADRNLSFISRLSLYKRTTVYLIKSTLPPKLQGIKTSDQTGKGFWGQTVAYVNLFRSKLRDPLRKARLWAFHDYCLRRFGDCPEAVRMLQK